MIRKASRADAARIHELHTASVRTLCVDHYSKEIIDGWLRHRTPQGYLPGIDNGRIFVAEQDGRIAGFGEASAGEVIAVFVDPNAARRGLGTALARHALAEARHGHVGSIRLESTLNAVPSMSGSAFGR